MMQDNTPKPRASRRFKVVLALSLALNLLFVGLIAGAMWRNVGGPGARWAGPGMQSYAAPYVRALPRAERRAINRSIRAAHPEVGRKARRAAYAAVIDALRAEPFDAQALETIMGAQRDMVLTVQQAAQARWVTAVTAMSPDARIAYANRLQEQVERGGRRGRKRDRHAD